MAHYNLYKSLGLDRAQDSITLGAELDKRINSGETSNPGGEEELQVARAILGDPARRSVYDFQLDDRNAPEITVGALRQLAAMDLNPPELDDDEDTAEDTVADSAEGRSKDDGQDQHTVGRDGGERSQRKVAPETKTQPAPEVETKQGQQQPANGATIPDKAKITAEEPERDKPKAAKPKPAKPEAATQQKEQLENPHKPEQHFPSTSPNLPVVDQASAAAQAPTQTFPRAVPPQAGTAPAGTAPAATAPARSKQWGVLPWVIGIVATLLLAGVGAYWYVRFGATDPWAGREARLARTFPELVSQRDGGRGFEGMTCTSQDTTGDEVSKIRCVNRSEGVSIVEFDSYTQRNSALPESGQVERFGKSACEINSIELPEQATPAYLIAPEAPLDRYLFVVNGNQAEQLRVRLPIC